MRLIKLLVILVLAAVIALVGYAYLGDMSPQQREIRNSIPVEGGELAPAAATPADQAEAPDAAASMETPPASEDAPEDAAETEATPAPITEEDTSEAPGD
ncbi:hypothetical protein FNJ84_11260 [Paracoccus sp. M683]|uniref:hypothetical protein n=1 Tax=Paracoccus sp. M683 TaxID=2594268 RepID=UPI00117F1CA4|nr:hypothetical protein [Paracoccus sp. M683]TRW96653.1 hypothetical protein FNJ84_11260 [Paracoccus sp. M683]